MDFRDFPMILGKSGKYEIHPPKLCAGLQEQMRMTQEAGPSIGKDGREEFTRRVPESIALLTITAVTKFMNAMLTCGKIS